jgi:para-nitrobenzyl esterase
MPCWPSPCLLSAAVAAISPAAAVLLSCLFAGAALAGPDPSAPGAAAEADEVRPVEVATRSGRWRGALRDGIAAFRGIEYGDDTRLTRFQPPRPEPAWQGVRDALEPRPRCPQVWSEDAEAELNSMSEDCLSLNVWTPAVGEGARPVLVYFHGGGYANGSVNEPVYDGARLARRGDVVVVTVNHRLNGFGYLYLGDIDAERYADSGNVGQLDLLLALRWVQDNIANFGGDSQRVTVFGQSGGGAKIATLMAMPAARGLFHRAWTMSGQQITGRRLENAQSTAREVLQRLVEMRPGDPAEVLEQASTRDLMQAMRGGTWTPVVDVRSLPRDPFSPDAPPQSADIPMVLGNTHDETTSLIGRADPAMFELEWDEVPAALRTHVAPFIGDLDPAEIVRQYRAWYPDYSPSQVFFSATTAARSWKGMVLASERRARQGAPTWIYYLHWPAPLEGGRWGAPHTLDIPLVFDTVAADDWTREGGAEAQRMADLMSEALIAFARSGDPNTPALPQWPRFELPERSAMIFELPPRVAQDDRRAERRLFKPIPYLQPGT